MRKLVLSLTLTSLCPLSLGCTSVVGEIEELGVKQQGAGTPTVIRYVSAYEGGDSKATAMCSDGAAFALSVSGGSAVVEDNLVKSNLVADNGIPVGARTVLDGAPTATTAVCSDYDAPQRIRELAASGDHTVMCPTGFIAVGGEGQCEGSNGKLVRTRPVGVAGEPRGWRATCTSGPVRVGVNCVEQGGSRDWDGCKIVKTTLGDGAAYVSCDGNGFAIAGGGRCGNGGNLLDTYVSNSIAGADCTGGSTSGFGICCPGVTEIP